MYHGDIKTENILLTSANWVYLTDFAVFKPTLLPDNDPAGYYYFFENKGESESDWCVVVAATFVAATVVAASVVAASVVAAARVLLTPFFWFLVLFPLFLFDAKKANVLPTRATWHRNVFTHPWLAAPLRC